MMMFKLISRVALVTCLGIGMSHTSANAFEEAGADLSSSKLQSAKGYAAPADDDDDDAFFSGGANPAIATYRAPRAAFAAVDVAAVCSAVLAEGPTNYHQSFFEGCRRAVSQKTVRRANR